MDARLDDVCGFQNGFAFKSSTFKPCPAKPCWRKRQRTRTTPVIAQRIKERIITQATQPPKGHSLRKANHSVGVDELALEKLTPLLRLKYHNAITDAVADLGQPEEIGKTFAGFQKYLYQEVA